MRYLIEWVSSVLQLLEHEFFPCRPSPVSHPDGKLAYLDLNDTISALWLNFGYCHPHGHRDFEGYYL